MRDSQPKPIETLFNNRYIFLLHIQQRAIALLKLNRAVNALLPAQLRPWCHVANFRQGVMVIDTANASWMMRLRYEQKQLIVLLREKILPSLSSIDIKINPSLAVQEDNKAHQSRNLSLQSAEFIRNVAIRSEGKLQILLENLARLAGENKETI